MNKSKQSLLCFSSITLDDPVIQKNTAQAVVSIVKTDTTKIQFTLRLTYEHPINPEFRPLFRLAFCMPLLNYSLFSQKLILKFPISSSDYSLLNDFNTIFSRDIFVNKLLNKKNPYIIPEYFPDESTVTPHDAEPQAGIQPQYVDVDRNIASTTRFDDTRCGILSSGGKDSLLTYGLLKEIHAEVYPLYINESGGHWRTALTAYRYHRKTDPNTARVWTNVDRFYTFMLDHVFFIKPHHHRIRADIYPIHLCVFPYYIFSLLPLFIENSIGNLLMGNEFDDVRYEIRYRGIKHYYGIYDQHQDFDRRMNEWYTHRVQGLHQWSALLSISGLVGQRILFERYPDLSQQQRSCHSCHIHKNTILPCGKCSKCHGILLFLLANNLDPKKLQYTDQQITSFLNTIDHHHLKLDEDEKNQAFFLLKNKSNKPTIGCIDHVQKIHLSKTGSDPDQIPLRFRKPLFSIFEQYTTGYCTLDNETWVPIDSVNILKPTF
ncbi:MAG: hypothetical protein QXX20_06785 [Candidatus Thermoplasmatota archaeon]